MCGAVAGAGPYFASALRAMCVDPGRTPRLYVAGDGEVKLFDPSGRLLRRWSTALAGFRGGGGCARVGVCGGRQGNWRSSTEAQARPLRTWRSEGVGEVTAIGLCPRRFIADS